MSINTWVRVLIGHQIFSYYHLINNDILFLDEILKPILLASQNLTRPAQKSVNKLALEILCEAWLDHIYKYRIKFRYFIFKLRKEVEEV